MKKESKVEKELRDAIRNFNEEKTREFIELIERTKEPGENEKGNRQ